MKKDLYWFERIFWGVQEPQMWIKHSQLLQKEFVGGLRDHSITKGVLTLHNCVESDPKKDPSRRANPGAKVEMIRGEAEDQCEFSVTRSLKKNVYFWSAYSVMNRIARTNEAVFCCWHGSRNKLDGNKMIRVSSNCLPAIHSKHRLRRISHTFA